MQSGQEEGDGAKKRGAEGKTGTGTGTATDIEMEKSDAAADRRGGGLTPEEVTALMINELPETLSRENTVYDLYAVCNHSGRIGSGHYFTFARDSTNQWRRYDDSSVLSMAEETVETASAYLLFYRRRDLADAPLSDVFPRFHERPRSCLLYTSPSPRDS